MGRGPGETTKRTDAIQEPATGVDSQWEYDPQRELVEEHFANASNEWGRRYERKPRRMSDLDLLLRREHTQRLLGPLLEHRGSPIHLLDVGCGAGNLLATLPCSRTVKLHGVDLVPEMLQQASRRNRDARFSVADATRIPFSTGSMNVVTCLGVLEYIPESHDVLDEIARVLQPGGHLIISFPNRVSLFRRLSIIEISAERTLGQWLRWIRRKPAIPDDAPAYRHTPWSPREAEGLLRAAGFADIDMLFNTFGLWGRIGRSSMALALSRFLTRHLGNRRWVASSLACTIVARAVKPPC